MTATIPAHVSRARLATELDVAESTVDEMIKRGVLPKPMRPRSGDLVWNWEEVERRLAALPRVGTVYVVGFGQYVKIGFTFGFVEQRLKALQTGAPERLQLISQFPGTVPDETTLHRRFAAQRTVGEWFRRIDAIAAWLDAGCPQ